MKNAVYSEKLHGNGKTPAFAAPLPDKPVPFDEDSERNILGALMIDAGLLPEIVAKGVTPETFFIGRYQRIFSTMLELHGQGQTIAPVTVASRLQPQELDGIDWLIQLQTIEAETLSVYAALTCADLIKEKEERRNSIDFIGQALALFDEASKQAYDESTLPDLTPSRLVEELQARSRQSSPQSGIDGWQLCTLADAYQPRPPVIYAIEGLFSLPSLNMVYGAPGTLKSMLLADALICVAAGLPWLEALPGNAVKPFQTVSSSVLWVDFDNGKRRTAGRFEALARARNLPATLPTLFYASMPDPWLTADDKSSVDALIRLARGHGIKVIALDNLGLISGGVDENSPGMIPVMGNLRRLAEETEAAVIVLHHQRKSTGFKSRAGETLRGHSCIEASLDLALLVEREDDGDQVGIKSTKTRDVDVQPFSGMWTYEHKPGSKELSTARFFGVISEDSEKIDQLQTAIMAAVKTSPGISQTKLRETVKAKLPDAGILRIRSEIQSMVERSQLTVVETGTGKASAYYPNSDYVAF